MTTRLHSTHPMKQFVLNALMCCAIALASRTPAAERSLSLHPDNPHYFQFRDRPAVLVTSGEHYGAVLNLDFDFSKYLEALRRDGLNLTRTFTGSYVEPPGSFNITS